MGGVEAMENGSVGRYAFPCYRGSAEGIRSDLGNGYVWSDRGKSF